MHKDTPNSCTVQLWGGEFCDAPSAEDVPFPICMRHALRLFRHMGQRLREYENNMPKMLQVIADQIDENRARDAKRAASKKTIVHDPVVYYVLVGSLMKIGTSTNLRRRLLAYPPNRRLLATEPGGRSVESRRHAEFADLLDSGREWFRFEGTLVEWVQSIRAKAA